MEIENTSIRLKKIMHEKNLRQIDLLEMVKPFCEKYNVKINKSDISQYLSGKVKPGQEKLSMLGMALNVREAWLMGYDVPMERQQIENTELTSNEKILLSNYKKLDNTDKTKVIDYTNLLINQNKYKNSNITELPKKKEIWQEEDKEHLKPKAAHMREGATEEDIQHDNDMMDNDDLWND